MKYKFFFASIIISTMISCKSQKADFKSSVMLCFEKGTDSTEEWKYIQDGIFIDTNQIIDAHLLQMVTLAGGGTYMLTNFNYSKESGYNNLTHIKTIFSIDETLHKYGHYFDFEINQYSWLVGDENFASYICHFDSLGNILDELGTIRVDGYKHSQKPVQDLFFTTVFHDVDSIYIVGSNSAKKKYISKSHVWMPMLDYISLDYSVDDVFYITTYATRRKDKLKQIYNDTFHVK